MGIKKLVKKAKKGNWQAFLDLVFMKKDMLYNKAFMIVKNQQDASDAIHDAIIKAYDSIDQLKDPQYFHTWFTRILIHKCVDIVRKNRKTVYLDSAILENKRIEKSKDIAQSVDLKKQLKELPEKFRIVLVLRYFEDLKVSEIAQILNLPEGTVKSRIYHGLAKLRNSMKGDEANEM